MMQPMQGAYAQVNKPQAIEHYHMETVVVIHKITGLKTFYKVVLGGLRRIGKEEHHKIVCEAWKASCMYTTGAANPKSTHIRHYTTWHFRMTDFRKSVH